MILSNDSLAAGGRQVPLALLLAAGLALPVAGGPPDAADPPGGIGGETARSEAPLCLDPEHPFYPRRGGESLFLLGASDRAALTLWRSEKGFDWRRYLATLAEHGFNYVREDACAWQGLAELRKYSGQFSSLRWPFARRGPGRAVDGLPRFDLTRFDDGYFRDRLRPFLQEAERLGIVVELTLFDDCRRRRAFAGSLYARANNVNELGLEAGDDPHGDGALENRRLRAVQEGWVERVVEETAGLGNVIFEVANETGGARWVEHFVDFIHHARPGALVSAGEQGSPYDPVAGRCDLAVKHRGAGGAYLTEADIARHRRSLISMRAGKKPVLHNEFFLFARGSSRDPAFVRKMFWADFTAGGHSNFYDFTWWRGTGRRAGEGTPSRDPPEEILEAGRHLRAFIATSDLPLARLEPRDDLSSPPPDASHPTFVLAAPGELWVVYRLGGGTFGLRLPCQRGLSTRWYDPRRGTWSEAASVDRKGAARFTAPDRRDWVLLVRAGSARRR